MDLIVVDIDGTLADHSERLAAAGAAPSHTDRAAFLRWLDAIQDEERLAADAPVPAMRELLGRLGEQTPGGVIYLTSREEKYREVTRAWLEKHNFPDGPLLMRPSDDWRSTAQVKGEKIRDVIEHYGAGGIVTIDDDPDGSCSPVYKALGVVHLKAMWTIPSGRPELKKEEKAA